MRKVLEYVQAYFERIAPLAIATISGLAFYFCKDELTTRSEVIAEMDSDVLTVSSMLIGFLLTIYTILSTITTRRMRFVQGAGSLGQLKRYLSLAIIFNLILSIYILIMPSLLQIQHDALLILTQVGFVFLTVYGIALSVRFIWLFLQIMVED